MNGFWQRFFHLMKEFRLHLVWEVLKTGIEFLWTYLGLSTATIVGFVMLTVRWVGAHRYSDHLFVAGIGLSATSILLLGIKIGMKLKRPARTEPVVAPAQMPVSAAAATTTADAPKPPEKPLIVIADDEQIMRFDPKVSAIERGAQVAATSVRPSVRQRYARAIVALICLSCGFGATFLAYRYSSNFVEAPSKAMPPVAMSAPHENNEVRVWVNTTSGIYHCLGSRWYGKSSKGIYITQSEAKAKGYRPAHNRPCRPPREYYDLYNFLNAEVREREQDTAPLIDKLARMNQLSDEETNALLAWIGDVNDAGDYGCFDILDSTDYRLQVFISNDIREKLEHRERLSSRELRSLFGWFAKSRRAVDSCRERATQVIDEFR